MDAWSSRADLQLQWQAQLNQRLLLNFYWLVLVLLVVVLARSTGSTGATDLHYCAGVS
jgi:hypothetical protein